jgi:hypothetical protein
VSTALETGIRIKRQYGLGRSFKEEVQGSWSNLSSTYILVGSVPGSPVAAVLGNGLVPLADPLLPTFIHIVCVLIRALSYVT